MAPRGFKAPRGSTTWLHVLQGSAESPAESQLTLPDIVQGTFWTVTRAHAYFVQGYFRVHDGMSEKWITTSD